MFALIVVFLLVSAYAVCLIDAAAELYRDWHSSRSDYSDFEDLEDYY